jgi:peptidoglycan hydrolase-like protein with peptidoglycan-binding domain
MPARRKRPRRKPARQKRPARRTRARAGSKTRATNQRREPSRRRPKKLQPQRRPAAARPLLPLRESSPRIEVLAATACTELGAPVGANGENRAEDVLAVQRRLVDLGFDWLPENGVADADTLAAIRLFQAIKNGHQRVDLPQNDGRIDPGRDTHRWLDAPNAPRWLRLLPSSLADGFHNAEREAAGLRHDCGTNWLEETVIAAAARYQAQHRAGHRSAAPFTIRHASLPRGGPTPDHRTHQTGLACDARVPRNDATGLGVTWNLPGTSQTNPLYDRAAMRAMLEALHAQTLFRRALFNDSALIAEGLCIAATGHDDHVHFEVGPPPRGES